MTTENENLDRDRIEFRADPDWIKEVREEAENLGMGVSAYVRLCINERLRRTRDERRNASQRN